MRLGSTRAAFERGRHLVLGWVSAAVNLFEVRHAAAGSSPSLRATGDDTNIDVVLVPKGSGRVKENATVLLRAGDAPTAHAASHQNGGGDEIATTTAASGAIPKASADGRVPDRFSRYFCFARRLFQATHDLGATTWSVVGSLVSMTQISTGTPVVTSVDGTKPYESHVTSNVSGDAAGRITSDVVTQRGYNPIVGGAFSTGAGIASIRLWVGLFSVADPSATSAPTTDHFAAFRFDTGAGDSGTWRAVTSDGATNTVTDTGIAIAISSRYTWRIEQDASEVRFYINDVLGATHTTNLPGLTTQLRLGGTVTTLTSATKRLFLDFFYMLHD